MKSFVRVLVLAVAAAGFSFSAFAQNPAPAPVAPSPAPPAAAPAPAQAAIPSLAPAAPVAAPVKKTKARHHIHHAKTHRKHHRRHVHHRANAAVIKSAQTHLANLGYYKGKIDGVMGRKTRAALKTFQKEHLLKADGILGPKTTKALADADHPAPPPTPPVAAAPTAPPKPPEPPKFYTEHKDFYGYVGQKYSNPMLLGAPVVPSRFARVDVTEKDHGTLKTFDVKVDGKPLFTAPNQPAVIGISKTFTLRDEDAVIFSTYRDGDLVCNYQQFLFILGAHGNTLHEIGDCTRGYQVTQQNDMLTIVFPEKGTGRVAGATWRYDHGTLTRL